MFYWSNYLNYAVKCTYNFTQCIQYEDKGYHRRSNYIDTKANCQRPFKTREQMGSATFSVPYADHRVHILL